MGERGGISGEVQTARVAAGGGEVVGRDIQGEEIHGRVETRGDGEEQEEEIHGREEVLLKAGRRRR